MEHQWVNVGAAGNAAGGGLQQLIDERLLRPESSGREGAVGCQWVKVRVKGSIAGLLLVTSALQTFSFLPPAHTPPGATATGSYTTLHAKDGVDCVNSPLAAPTIYQAPFARTEVC